MKYSASVQILDDNGEVVYERALMQDEIIAELIGGVDPEQPARRGIVESPVKKEEDEESIELMPRAGRKAILPKNEFIGKVKAAAAVRGGGDQKKGKSCRLCGVAGHNAKTCTRRDEVAAQLAVESENWEARKEKKRRDGLEIRVKRMIDGGLSAEDIKEALMRGGELKEQEAEQLIAWAQHGVG